MTEDTRHRLRGWGLPIMLSFMALMITVETALLVPVMVKQSDQAQAGSDARARQCSIAPVSDKEQRWFLANGVITERDLAMYRRGAPSRHECADIRAQK